MVDLPEWGVTGILAKIDTGARTSAIHVEGIKSSGTGKVSFDVIHSRKPTAKRTTVEASIVRETRIKTSTGHYQDRFVVETMMKIGEKKKRIQLTLVSRKHMICRMLIGRTALEGDFLVDVALRHTAKLV